MTKPLIAYYGDDFTGSADVMEVLQWAGLRTVLFLKPPTAEQLRRFDDLRAFGVAGWSRTMSASEMDEHLKPALSALHDSQASIVHYKTCSTFDSSPDIGSIGRALEIGREVVRDGMVPIVIGAPNLGRYQVFGNLFARSGLDSEPYRLDRHPTMRRHPITPMNEADLRVHLAAQTDAAIELIDVLELGSWRNAVDSMGGQVDGLLFDVLNEEHLSPIGAAIESLAEQGSNYAIGSSGIEYALTAHWEANGCLDSLRSHEPGHPKFGPANQLLVITGSCSPVNDRQIAWALEHGFEQIPLSTASLIDPEQSQVEIESVVGRALDQLRAGSSVIVHSSRGPDDPRVAATLETLGRQGFSPQDIRLRSGRTIGPKLGQILGSILAEYPMHRVAVAGGDTSGYVASELGLTALEAIAPVAPGSPLCRATAENALDGVEFFFKGGQVGKDDVWGTMLHGTEAMK